MKKTITYTDEPLGDIQVVADFLPPPEQLVFREDKGKSAECAERSTSMNASLKEALIHFLNQPEIIALMQENSDNDRPAVEGLGDILLTDPAFQEYHQELERSGAQIGKMVKEVLENNDYDWESDHHPVKGKLFGTGSRYKRRKK